MKRDTISAVQAKKAKTTQAVARAGLIDISSQSAWGSDDAYMLQYLRSTYRDFCLDPSVALSFDGATHGGDETLLICAFSTLMMTGAWLPPQVYY